jgi:hypothetical protein
MDPEAITAPLGVAVLILSSIQVNLVTTTSAVRQQQGLTQSRKKMLMATAPIRF